MQERKYFHKALCLLLSIVLFWSGVFPYPEILFATSSSEILVPTPSDQWTVGEILVTENSPWKTEQSSTLENWSPSLHSLSQPSENTTDTSLKNDWKKNIQWDLKSTTHNEGNRKFLTETWVSQESVKIETGSITLIQENTGIVQTWSVIEESSEKVIEASGAFTTNWTWSSSSWKLLQKSISEPQEIFSWSVLSWSTFSGGLDGKNEIIQTGSIETGSTESGEIIIEKWHQAVQSIGGKNIVATFTEDTLVKTADNSDIQEEMIRVEDVKESIGKNSFVNEATQDENTFVFEFGKKDTHLKFSHPVEISLDAPSYLGEWDRVELAVVHADNPNPTTDSLTLNKEDTCIAWKASHPASLAKVKDGKITFYTCGASTFILNATGTSSGITLWLRADAGTCGTKDCDVSTWNDQSGKNNPFASSTITKAKFTYSSPVLNFRPVVRFAESSSYRLANWNWAKAWYVSNLNPRTIFIVYSHTDTKDWTTPFTTDAKSALGIPNGLFHGSNMWTVYDSDWTASVAKDGQNFVNGTSANLLTTMRPKVLQLQTRILTQNINDTIWYFIGTDRDINLSSRRMAGDIAEIIVYDSVLSSDKRKQIESYLAIKNGITLDQSTPQSYFLSNGLIAWDANTAWVFKNNIAWFGRDDATTLSTNISQSVDNTEDIIIASSANISNLQTLMWANNGASTGSWQTTGVPIGMSRLPRSWQIQEKFWDIGNVTVRYKANTLPAGLSGSLLLLQNSYSSDFPYTSNQTITWSIVNGYWEFNLNLQDGAYITFAQGNVSDTTAPLLSITSLSWSVEPIGNFSKNISYSDTGSSINVSSFSGRLLRWNASSGVYEAIGGASFSSITETGAVFTATNLSFWKYRLDTEVSDQIWNIKKIQTLFYIDTLEWNISTDVHDIGDVSPNVEKNASSDITITVKTIGAPFRITMIQKPLHRSWFSIPFWNNTIGVGYEKAPYVWNLASAESPGVIIANNTGSIDQNWQQKTYTFNIRYSTQVSDEQMAGQYVGDIGFQLTADY